MKKMKWILLAAAGLVVVGGAGGGLALSSWLNGQLTRESLIRQLESQWNCRADLQTLTVSLWSSPARVDVKGLMLAIRDEDANAGTALASRKPITSGNSLVGTDEVLLEVELADLIRKRLHVKRLTLSGVRVRNSVSPEGVGLLDELFRKPLPPVSAAPVVVASQTSSPTPPAPEVAVSTTHDITPDPKPKTVKTKSASFEAEELGMSVVIDEARLEQGSFHEANRQAHTKTDISDLRLALTQVDLDPADLAHHDQCKLDISARVQSAGRAKVGDATQDVKVADFTLASSGTVRPMDPATGKLAPLGTLSVELKKGSVFGGTMTIGELAGKDKGFDNMKKNFGIDVSDIVVGGQLQDDMRTQLNVNNGRVEFAQDAKLPFADYTMTMHAGSWLNGAEDLHEMNLQLVPSEAVAKRLMDGVATKLGEGLTKTALSLFNDGQGHLAFDLMSSGKLSKPKIELAGQAGTLQKALQGLGGGMLKGLIK